MKAGVRGLTSLVPFLLTPTVTVPSARGFADSGGTNAFSFSDRVYLEDAARVDAVTVKRCCTFWYSPSKRG